MAGLHRLGDEQVDALCESLSTRTRALEQSPKTRVVGEPRLDLVEVTTEDAWLEILRPGAMQSRQQRRRTFHLLLKGIQQARREPLHVR